MNEISVCTFPILNLKRDAKFKTKWQIILWSVTHGNLHHLHTQREKSLFNTAQISQEMSDINRRRGARPISFLKAPVQDAFEGEGEEFEALAGVKLVLELHPVQKIKAPIRRKTMTRKPLTR